MFQLPARHLLFDDFLTISFSVSTRLQALTDVEYHLPFLVTEMSKVNSRLWEQCQEQFYAEVYTFPLTRVCFVVFFVLLYVRLHEYVYKRQKILHIWLCDYKTRAKWSNARKDFPFTDYEENQHGDRIIEIITKTRGGIQCEIGNSANEGET